jgi:hypothetical protein
MNGFGKGMIVLMDITVILSKFLEVNEITITYHKYSNLKGPIKTID